MYTASGGEGDCTLRDLHAAAVLLNRAVLEPTCHDNVMLSPWRCILIVLVSACWVHAAPDDRRVKSQSLQFNLCRAFNTEQFVCDKILGHFCSFCVDPDAPEGSADKSICDTKSDVKRRERGELLHDHCPAPAGTSAHPSLYGTWDVLYLLTGRMHQLRLCKACGGQRKT